MAQNVKLIMVVVLTALLLLTVQSAIADDTVLQLPFGDTPGHTPITISGADQWIYGNFSQAGFADSNLYMRAQEIGAFFYMFPIIEGIDFSNAVPTFSGNNVTWSVGDEWCTYSYFDDMVKEYLYLNKRNVSYYYYIPDGYHLGSEYGGIELYDQNNVTVLRIPAPIIFYNNATTGLPESQVVKYDLDEANRWIALNLSTYNGAWPALIDPSATWTGAGTYTWTVPAGVNTVDVCIIGGGGGGGGGARSWGPNNNGNAGGGGGSGYKNNYTSIAVTPGQVITIVVGAGGSGAGVCTNDEGSGASTQYKGANGGQSSFGAYTAAGGNGGYGGQGAYWAGSSWRAGFTPGWPDTNYRRDVNANLGGTGGNNGGTGANGALYGGGDTAGGSGGASVYGGYGAGGNGGRGSYGPPGTGSGAAAGSAGGAGYVLVSYFNSNIVSMNATNFYASQFSGSVSVTVKRSTSTDSISVNYATADGTAAAGTDYTATSGTLVFAPGELEKVVTIPILTRPLYVSNYYFAFNLVSTNSTSGFGSPRNATINLYPPVNMMGYQYEQTHLITGSPDGALADYQVPIDIYSGIGVSTGSTVFLNNHALSFPNDIRFANAIDMQLPYYIESNNSTYARVWVKIDYITASAASQLKIYYGKVGDMGASDGVTTFPLFFDNFANMNNWTAGYFVSENNGAWAAMNTGYNTPSVSGNNAVLDGTRSATDAVVEDGVNSGWWGRSIRTKNSIAANAFAVRVLSWYTQSGGTGYPNYFESGIVGVGQDKDNYVNGKYYYPSASGQLYMIREVANVRTATAGGSTALSASTWYSADFTFINGGNAGYATNGVSMTSAMGTTYSSKYITLAFDHRAPSATMTQKFGAVMVRGYTANEPTHGITGAENFTTALVQFNLSSCSVNENTSTVTINVSRTGSPLACSVNYATANGNATAGQNYTAASGTLNFAAGEMSKTFTVSITDNAIFDVNRFFYVNLSAPVSCIIGNNTAQVFIKENDAMPVVRLSATQYSVNENAGSITITVNKNGSTALPCSVNYATANGNASQPANYTGTSGTLTFAIGDTSKTFAVPIIDNSVYDYDRFFYVNLSSPTTCTLSAPASAQVFIRETDTAPVLTVNPTSYTVNENVGTLNIMIVRDKASTIPGTVTYNLSNGSAKFGINFNNTPNLYYSANQPSPREATNNPWEENTSLTANVTSWTNISIPNPTARTWLMKKDGKFINGTYGANQWNGLESDFSKVVGQISPGDMFTVSFWYNTSNTVSTGMPTVFSLSFYKRDWSGRVSNSVTTPIIYDGQWHYATMTIVANASYDGPIIADGPSWGYALNKSGQMFINDIRWHRSNGTITMPAGQTGINATINIMDDGSYDVSKSFTFNLGGASYATVGSPRSATITVTNTDPIPIVQLNLSSYSVNENGGTATITVTKAGSTNLPLSVNYTTANGNASAGQNYTAASGTLNFAATDTSKTFTVPITDNTIYDNNRFLYVNLSSPNQCTLGANATARVFIQENEAKPVVQLSATKYIVNENAGSVTITVSKTGSTIAIPFSVNYATANGNATAGTNYTATSGTLNFAAGDTSKTFNVPIINNPAYDYNKFFYVNLSSPVACMPGTNTSAQVFINEDDAVPVIGFNPSSYSVNENGGSVNLALTRSIASAVTAMVNYTTTNGNATAGQNYTATSGQVTFTPADMSKTITVPVTDNAIYDLNKVFYVNLSSPAGCTLGSNAVVTITENEAAPSIQFSSSSYSVNENAGTVTITVNKAGSTTALPFSVNYATANGNATSGQNFTAASGTLSFAAGDTSKTFTVPVTDNTFYGNNKVFFVNLSLPSKCTMGAPNTAIVTIIENEVVPTASFHANVTLGVGTLCVYFTDDSTGLPTAWQWNFGDSTANSTMQNPVHVYSVAGVYTVTLTASNAGGSGGLQRAGYIVVNAPKPVVNFTANQTFGYAPVTVQFWDNSSSNITARQWNFGDGTANSTVQNPVHTYSTPGLYNVMLTVTNQIGTNTTQKAGYINVIPMPVIASFTSNVTAGFAPLTIRFNDTSLNTPDSWQWSYGDGTANSTVQNPVHTFGSAGNYSVVLTVRNAIINYSTSCVNNIAVVAYPPTPTPVPTPTPLPTLSPSPTPNPSLVDNNKYNAQWLDVSEGSTIPSQIVLGRETDFNILVRNTGSQTWTSAQYPPGPWWNGVHVVFPDDMVRNLGMTTRWNGVSSSQPVPPGSTMWGALFRVNATVLGQQTIRLQMYKEGTPFGQVFTRTINVVPQATPPANAPDYGWEVVSNNIPDSAYTYMVTLPPASMTIRNTGKQPWPGDGSIELKGVGDYSYLHSSINYLGVNYGETLDSSFYLMAPHSGTTTLQLQMQRNGVPFGSTFTKTINGIAPTPTPTPTPAPHPRYYDINVMVQHEDGTPFSGVTCKVLDRDNNIVYNTAMSVGNGWANLWIGDNPTRWPYKVVCSMTGYQNVEVPITSASQFTYNDFYGDYFFYVTAVMHPGTSGPTPTPVPTPTPTPTSTPVPTPTPVPTSIPTSSYLQVFPSDYEHVKAHTIVGSSDGPLTDYPIPIVMHKGSVSSGDPNPSGNDVYLDFQSYSWPQDVRFTNILDQPLKYWIEYDAYTDPNTAIAWVKVDSIPQSGTTIFMHYGKYNDPGAGNANDVFEFFDDFSGSGISSLWQTSTGTTNGFSVSNGFLTLSGTANTIKSVRTFSNSIAIDARIMSNGNPINGFTGCGFGLSGSGSFAHGTNPGVDLYQYASGMVLECNDGANENLLTDPAHATQGFGSYNVYSIYYKDTGSSSRDISVHATRNNQNIAGSLCLVETAWGPLSVFAGSAQSNCGLTVDWIRARKYTQHEPGQSEWYSISTCRRPSSELQEYDKLYAHVLYGPNTDNPLIYYPVKIVVHRGTAPAGQDPTTLLNCRDVYLNDGCANWPYDIRFTNAEEQKLPYAIDPSFTDQQATFWVILDQLPEHSGQKLLFLHYGRSSDPGEGISVLPTLNQAGIVHGVWGDLKDAYCAWLDAQQSTFQNELGETVTAGKAAMVAYYGAVWSPDKGTWDYTFMVAGNETYAETDLAKGSLAITPMYNKEKQAVWTTLNPSYYGVSPRGTAPPGPDYAKPIIFGICSVTGWVFPPLGAIVSVVGFIDSSASFVNMGVKDKNAATMEWYHVPAVNGQSQSVLWIHSVKPDTHAEFAVDSWVSTATIDYQKTTFKFAIDSPPDPTKISEAERLSSHIATRVYSSGLANSFSTSERPVRMATAFTPSPTPQPTITPTPTVTPTPVPPASPPPTILQEYPKIKVQTSNYLGVYRYVQTATVNYHGATWDHDRQVWVHNFSVIGVGDSMSVILGTDNVWHPQSKISGGSVTLVSRDQNQAIWTTGSMLYTGVSPGEGVNRNPALAKLFIDGATGAAGIGSLRATRLFQGTDDILDPGNVVDLPDIACDFYEAGQINQQAVTDVTTSWGHASGKATHAHYTGFLVDVLPSQSATFDVTSDVDIPTSNKDNSLHWTFTIGAMPNPELVTNLASAGIQTRVVDGTTIYYKDMPVDSASPFYGIKAFVMDAEGHALNDVQMEVRYASNPTVISEDYSTRGNCFMYLGTKTASGNFDFNTGTYSLTFTKYGYQTAVVPVNVVDSNFPISGYRRDIEVGVYMQPAS